MKRAGRTSRKARSCDIHDVQECMVQRDDNKATLCVASDAVEFIVRFRGCISLCHCDCLGAEQPQVVSSLGVSNRLCDMVTNKTRKQILRAREGC